MPQVFISYARKDYHFVERLRGDLQRAKIDYWIDHEGLSAGTRNWERAIRKAIAESDAMIWIVSPASYESEYVSSELAIADLHKLKIYPVFAEGDNWVECVQLGKHNIQYADMRREKYPNGLADLLKALGGSKPEIAVPLSSTPTLATGQTPRNPYKGLMAFTEKDAGDFYGREALIAKLQTRLIDTLSAKQARFLAVLGPSGAGKSSVVMAGLIPSLKKIHTDWVFLPKIVPGKNPLEKLTDALYRAMPHTSLSGIETDLKNPGGQMLHRLTQQIDGAHVLLYIDQFEELFTLTQDEDERQQFISLITQAVTEPDGKLIVVLSMRADFYGHPLNYPQLGQLVNQHNEAVLPMSISELRDAIEKPAQQPDVALTFDDGLILEIIFALRERDKALAGALPLLQFTLERLFAERDGTHLTWGAYNALGDPAQGVSGVEGAIGTHCEDVFVKLPETVQAKLGQVFLPLVSIDEASGEPTRQRASLAAVSKDDEAKGLVDALVRERLLQTGIDGDEPYLEITHEALFKTWKRLKDWIASIRDDLRLLRQVEREANDWHSGGRAYLPTAERLTPIHAAVTRLNYGLNSVMQDFVYPQAMLLRELDKPKTSEQRRLRIGDDLAMLGDPRPGVSVQDGLPDILWLSVATGGEIEIKGKTFTVQPFYIAKYLITYTQYQVFVEADDGFQNLKWWRGFPKDYQPQALAEQRTKSVNNPRDSLSWYQSEAFARWLDAKYRETGMFARLPVGTRNGASDKTIPLNPDDWQIRLPTEWEWQWAAQGGTQKLEYPWEYWQTGHANTSESGLGRAIAVGMYPHGAADCGALDMAGNLSEWCLNDYGNLNPIYNLNNNSKVLRGGSFGDDQSRAAASVRNLSLPDFDGGFVGLRVVLSPPIASLTSG